MAPKRVEEALLQVPAPQGDRPVPPDRLLRLDVRASQKTALPSRMEIYPRGMGAVRAVKLGMGSLLGPKSLAVRQIQERIGSRYPVAEPLPGPPALDRLLAEAGIALEWDGEQRRYVPQRRRSTDRWSSSTLPRVATGAGAGEAAAPEVEHARLLEQRIGNAVAQQRFLVLSVAPRHLLRAEQELAARFAVQRISLEALLIEQMKALAAQAGARWEVVLRADAAAPGSRDWRNLLTLVRRAGGGT